MSLPTTRNLTDATDGADAGGAGGGDDGGAAAAAAVAAAAAAAAGAGGGGAGGGAGAAWYEGFTSPDLKTHPSIHRYKGPEDLAAAYVNLEKRYGIDPNRRVDLPADMNDAAGMRAVYEKLGAPKDANGYGFKLADGATDFDKTFMGEVTAKFHEIGLSVKQAQDLLGFMDGQTQADQQRGAAALTARVAEGEAALKTELGAAYEPRLREVEKLVAKHGDADLLKAIQGDGLKANPNLTRFLVKILDRMAEPGAAGGESGDAASGDRAMTPSQAKAAARAIEADPAKSAALTDRNHAQHKAVVEERNRLLLMAEGKGA